MASATLGFPEILKDKPVKLWFQDEGRFGRINCLSRCWVPPKERAIVKHQTIRQYTYVYSALCPETGENYSLILPYADTDSMNIFMSELSAEFSKYRMIMVMDNAAWHDSKDIKTFDNIVPMFLPPYSPELNPVEYVWHYVKDHYGFKNKIFKSMQEVENQLMISFFKLHKDIDTVRSFSLFNWINSAI
jgi:transposase